MSEESQDLKIVGGLVKRWGLRLVAIGGLTAAATVALNVASAWSKVQSIDSLEARVGSTEFNGYMTCLMVQHLVRVDEERTKKDGLSVLPPPIPLTCKKPEATE